MRRGAALAVALIACALAPTGAGAHELQQDRLTLVQREPSHVALSFRVEELALLKRLLAPAASNADFFMPLSAMDDRGFAAALARARARFEAGVSLRDARGRAMKVEGWRWPPPEDVRRRVRSVVMQSMVGEGAHVHPEPVEVTADALADGAADEVDLKLPAAAGPMVVVSYRPMQQGYRPDRVAPLRITFGAPPVRTP